MSLILTVLWVVLAVIFAFVITYGVLLLGAIVFYNWQDKRAWQKHARARREGF